MSESSNSIHSQSSAEEAMNRERMFELFHSSPIPPIERLRNLGLYMKRQDLSRVLFMNDVYRHIVDVPGVVMEFGVRWGQNLSLFSSLRGIYEPFHHNRKIIGFDTFAGFPTVHANDGDHEAVTTGNYATTEDYDKHLAEVMECHEAESPIAHICKFELVRGDASVTINDYLKRFPETIVALAYFDIDLYEPTKHCLEAIRGRMPKGAVVGFDELNVRHFPGETRALQDSLGIRHCRLRRTPYSGSACYFVIE